MLRLTLRNLNKLGKVPTSRFDGGRRTLVTETLMTIPHFIQTAVYGLQATSGLPWWATIGLSTVAVKLCLFPLVRKQLLISSKVAKAGPDIVKLYKLMTDRIREMAEAKVGISQQAKLPFVFFSGARSALKVQGVSIPMFFAYNVVNMTLFVTFVFSLRDMIIEHGDIYKMTEGGLFWFTDLTEKDKTFALPVAAIMTTYTAVEISFQRVQGKLLFFKDFIQSLMILTLPAVVTLPAGVFCYWIPSSLFALGQSYAIRNDKFLSMIGVPVSGAPVAQHFVPMSKSEMDSTMAELKEAVKAQAMQQQHQSQSQLDPSSKEASDARVYATEAAAVAGSEAVKHADVVAGDQSADKQQR